MLKNILKLLTSVNNIKIKGKLTLDILLQPNL